MVVQRLVYAAVFPAQSADMAVTRFLNVRGGDPDRGAGADRVHFSSEEYCQGAYSRGDQGIVRAVRLSRFYGR